MRGRRWQIVGALLAVWTMVFGLVGPAASALPALPAQTPPKPNPTTTTVDAEDAPAPSGAAAATPPAAYVLVDLDTSAVIEQSNDRTPLPPASLTKILTALVVSAHVSPTDDIPVSPRAAGQEANLVGLMAGQTWKAEDVLYGLLLVSGNDAAMALAEKVGGSAEAFAQMMGDEAKKLGFADPDVFRDPAGLDDRYSVGGGNLISARDLAIGMKNLLADPWLARITGSQRYRFTAPDGIVHDIRNHNKMIQGLYPGTIGGKTGYTRKSGHDLIVAATRNGRTMLAVVLGANDTYGWAARLLDHGFATPVTAEKPGADRLTAPQATAAAPVAAATGATNPARVTTGGTGQLAAAAAGSPNLASSPSPSSNPLERPMVALGIVALALLATWQVHVTRSRSRRRRRVGV